MLKWGWGFANKPQNLKGGFVKPTLHNIFYIFCLIFLNDAIIPNLEKQIKTFFLRDCLGEGVEGVQNKTGFVAFRVSFVSGNKNIIQKKREEKFIAANFK